MGEADSSESRLQPAESCHEIEVSIVAHDFGGSDSLHVRNCQCILEIEGRERGVDVQRSDVNGLILNTETWKCQQRCKARPDFIVAQPVGGAIGRENINDLRNDGLTGEEVLFSLPCPLEQPVAGFSLGFIIPG